MQNFFTDSETCSEIGGKFIISFDGMNAHGFTFLLVSCL